MNERCQNELKDLKYELNLSMEVSGEEEKVRIPGLNLEVNLYYGDCSKPPIPKGYKYINGHWWTGFTIERISDGSQFKWVPVGALKRDATIDGRFYVEKFGRRESFKNKKYGIFQKYKT